LAAGGALAAGASCTIIATFAPVTGTGAGNVYGQLQVEASPGGMGAYNSYVALEGDVLTPADIVICANALVAGACPAGDYGNGSTFVFPGTVYQTASTPETWSVFNTGSIPATLGVVTLAGNDDGQFAIVADNCSNQSVAAGGSCTFGVTYDPTVVTGVPVGQASVSIVATNEAMSGTNPQVITNLEGSVVSAATLSYIVGQTNQTFAGSVVQDDDYTYNETGGADVTFEVQNQGGVATAVLTTNLAAASLFYVDSVPHNPGVGNARNCAQFMAPATTGLPAGDICTFYIDQKAGLTTAVGAQVSNFIVTAGTLNTATLTVTGGVLPLFIISKVNAVAAGTEGSAANPYDFGTVAAGATAGPATFLIENESGSASGGYTTGFLESSLSDQTDYSIFSDNCAGFSLAPQKTCTIAVQFNPSSTSASTGVVTVQDSASADNLTLNSKGNP
jgi:hypothetical protein